MRNLELEEARKQFSLLDELARASPAPLKIDVVEQREEFDSLRPVNQQDETVFKQQGAAQWELYGIRDDGSSSRVATRFGRRVIYPAQNLIIHETVPDDIDEKGETVGEAIKRCVEPFKCFVLHEVGHDRDEQEFNRVIISDFTISK